MRAPLRGYPPDPVRPRRPSIRQALAVCASQLTRLSACRGEIFITSSGILPVGCTVRRTTSNKVGRCRRRPAGSGWHRCGESRDLPVDHFAALTQRGDAFGVRAPLAAPPAHLTPACCGDGEKCCPEGCRPASADRCSAGGACGDLLCCEAGQTCTVGTYLGQPRAACCIPNPLELGPCDGALLRHANVISWRCPGKSNPCTATAVPCCDRCSGRGHHRPSLHHHSSWPPLSFPGNGRQTNAVAHGDGATPGETPDTTLARSSDAPSHHGAVYGADRGAARSQHCRRGDPLVRVVAPVTQTRPVAVPKPQPQNCPCAFVLASWQKKWKPSASSQSWVLVHSTPVQTLSPALTHTMPSSTVRSQPHVSPVAEVPHGVGSALDPVGPAAIPRGHTVPASAHSVGRAVHARTGSAPPPPPPPPCHRLHPCRPCGERWCRWRAG